MMHPYSPTNSWSESTAEEQNVNPEVINQIQTMIQEDFPHINSLLLLCNNHIIFEEYYNGYSQDSLQNTGCIFKNFISTAIGHALSNHIIHSLDDKIVDIFHDSLPAFYDKKIDKITLKHALTKSTGLNWRPPENNSKSTTYNKTTNDIGMVFQLDVITEPGDVFSYKPDPQILVYALEKLSGINFLNYMDTHIFKPLGIKDYRWDTNFQSIEKLQMTVRDIAKLGCLYLNEGFYGNQQIISSNYIKEATTPQISGGFPEQCDYGYLWWVNKHQDVPTYFASGFGGQYLFILPTFHIVSVITSKMDRPHPENKAIIRNIIEGLK